MLGGDVMNPSAAWLVSAGAHSCCREPGAGRKGPPSLASQEAFRGDFGQDPSPEMPLGGRAGVASPVGENGVLHPQSTHCVSGFSSIVASVHE